MPDDNDDAPEDVVITCSGSITLPPIGGSNDDGHALAETIRRYVRLHGGNVQAVFGR